MEGIALEAEEILFQNFIRKFRGDNHGMRNRWKFSEEIGTAGEEEGQALRKQEQTTGNSSENKLMKDWVFSFFVIMIGAFSIETMKMYSWNVYILFLGIGLNIGAWAKYRREMNAKHL